jgi:hypothetical protein
LTKIEFIELPTRRKSGQANSHNVSIPNSKPYG